MIAIVLAVMTAAQADEKRHEISVELTSINGQTATFDRIAVDPIPFSGIRAGYGINPWLTIIGSWNISRTQTSFSTNSYYDEYVAHLIDGKTVIPMEFYENKQAMYDQVNCVFHSSKSETYNYVYFECQLTDTKMDFLDSSLSDGELWTNDQIFNAWLDFLEIR